MIREGNRFFFVIDCCFIIDERTYLVLLIEKFIRRPVCWICIYIISDALICIIISDNMIMKT